MHQKIFLLALSSLTLANLAQAQWSPLASDDFESYTFGEQPGGNWYKLGNNASSAANELITNQTGGTATESGVTLPTNSAGSGNGLYFFDNSATSVSRAAINFGDSSQNYDVAYVSFDFSFATVDAGNTSSYGVIVLTSADTTALGSTSNQALAINLRYDGSLSWSGGSTSLVNPTASHTLEIVANGGDTNFSYAALDNSGDTLLSSNTYDLYLDGVRVDSAISFVTDTVALGRLCLNTYTSAASTGFIMDNLETYTAVPEPAQYSAVFSSFVLLIGLCMKRIRKS
ncbi:hypothetical protein [Coraliomargarita parva]|uniref:hypothetical protein n=1 Tax=Coraliomargarita parva TaxID=3014050 RepID=UPI0022B5227C|nr:hypothetical protein [Coraliomargarita parva]